MERLRITELLERHESRTGKAMSRTELAARVFGSEVGRPQAGKASPLSDSRKRNLISAWDGGKDLGRLKPRHVLRLADALRVKLIADLFEQ